MFYTFIGRGELLGWLNGTLKISLHKVEETANGAAACQLMDILHPNSVPMSKVNFAAKTEYDMTNNYKLLQRAFDRCKIDRVRDVSWLIPPPPTHPHIHTRSRFYAYAHPVPPVIPLFAAH